MPKPKAKFDRKLVRTLAGYGCTQEEIANACGIGETTLKRFVVQNGVPYLRASNPKYPDLIPARELVIQGVLIALLRLSER